MSGIMQRLLVAVVMCLATLPVDFGVQTGDDARQPASKQWPAVSGDWGNTRHSTLSRSPRRTYRSLAAPGLRRSSTHTAGARTMPVVTTA